MAQHEKFTLICPHCGYELTYNRSAIDRRMSKLGSEIRAIMNQLQDARKEYNDGKIPDTDDNHWFHNAKKALNYKQEELAELKIRRRYCEYELDKQMFESYKRLTIEKFGKEAHKEIMAKALEENKAYSMKALMEERSAVEL